MVEAIKDYSHISMSGDGVLTRNYSGKRPIAIVLFTDKHWHSFKTTGQKSIIISDRIIANLKKKTTKPFTSDSISFQALWEALKNGCSARLLTSLNFTLSKTRQHWILRWLKRSNCKIIINQIMEHHYLVTWNNVLKHING